MNSIKRYVLSIALTLNSLQCFCADIQLPEPEFKFSDVSTDLSRAVRSPNRFYDGQLIDMLAHIEPSYDVSLVLPLLKTNGIEFANFMPVPNEGMKSDDGKGTQLKIAFAKANPENINIFCGGDYLTIWLAENQQATNSSQSLAQRMNQLDADLKNGVCKGMGEFGLLHFAKFTNQHVITNKANSYPVLLLTDTIAKNNSWLQLHAEPKEPNGTSHHKEVFGGLALWFKRNPNIKIILSHTAMTNPNDARKILETYPNVYMSIKVVKSKQGNWNHLEPVTDLDGDFYEDWALLFEQMSERFFIGSDVKFGQKNNSDNEINYPRTIRSIRHALGGLTNQASENIAWKNAKRIFFIDKGNSSR